MGPTDTQPPNPYIMPADTPQPDPSRFLLRQQRLRDWQAANPSRRLQSMGYQAPPAAPAGSQQSGSQSTPNSQQSSLQPPGAFNVAIPTATRQQTVPSPRTGTGGGGGY